MAQTLIGIRPLNTRILVGIYDDGDTVMMLGGKKFFLLDDSSATKARDIHTKHQGVRDRWGLVLAISDDEQKHGSIRPGQKVLLEQLKWSRGIPVNIDGNRTKVWSIPSEDVLGIEDGEFTEMEQEQITRLYPNWKDWDVREV